MATLRLGRKTAGSRGTGGTGGTAGIERIAGTSRGVKGVDDVEEPLTVALITRVHIGELPYIQSFLDHYRKLGVNKIYVMVRPDHYGYTELMQRLAQYDKGDLYYHSFSEQNYSTVIPHITETYVLHVDCDEYLDLQGTLQDYIRKDPYPYYKFVWTMVTYQHVPAGRGFVAHYFKSMCRTDLVRECHDHFFVCMPRLALGSVQHSTVPLLHYWGRSFNDIVFKVVYGNYISTPRRSNVQELLAGGLPARFTMLSLLDHCTSWAHGLKEEWGPKAVVTSRASSVPIYVTVDREEEEYLYTLSLCSDVTKEYLACLEKRYMEHRPSQELCLKYFKGTLNLTECAIAMGAK